MSRVAYKSILRSTVMSVHQVNARWLASTLVQEKVKGRIIWEDIVDTFELNNHPEAKHCFAWSIDTAAGTMVLTALKIAPVISPQTAVHEAFVQGKMNPKRILPKK